MPSIECENGKWKWGVQGECIYDSKEMADEENIEYEENSENKEIMKKNEQRHVKEIIEDDETITIVYEKDLDDDGVSVKKRVERMWMMNMMKQMMKQNDQTSGQIQQTWKKDSTI